MKSKNILDLGSIMSSVCGLGAYTTRINTAALLYVVQTIYALLSRLIPGDSVRSPVTRTGGWLDWVGTN